MFVMFEWVEGNRWAAFAIDINGNKLLFLGYHFEHEGTSIEDMRLELEAGLRKIASNAD